MSLMDRVLLSIQQENFIDRIAAIEELDTLSKYELLYLIDIAHREEMAELEDKLNTKFSLYGWINWKAD